MMMWAQDDNISKTWVPSEWTTARNSHGSDAAPIKTFIVPSGGHNVLPSYATPILDFLKTSAEV
jgi:hypothetical protein